MTSPNLFEILKQAQSSYPRSLTIILPNKECRKSAGEKKKIKTNFLVATRSEPIFLKPPIKTTYLRLKSLIFNNQFRGHVF